MKIKTGKTFYSRLTLQTTQDLRLIGYMIEKENLSQKVVFCAESGCFVENCEASYPYCIYSLRLPCKEPKEGCVET